MGVIFIPKHMTWKRQQCVHNHYKIMCYHTGNVYCDFVPNVLALIFLTRKQMISIPTPVLQFVFTFIFWLYVVQSMAGVAINYIFGPIWRCYGPKQDILDYWGTIMFCLLSYYILSKDKGLQGWNNGYGKIPLEKLCHWNNSHIHKYYGTYCKG